jgi:isocitrate dehydrogenase
MIIDIGAARLADTPELFDVIVTLNLYGDIISDIAAQIAGSVGLAGSANIGEEFAMFEAIHGSAPDIAGKNMANPSGLLQAALMMLNHIGQNDVAEKIQNAWLKTMEDRLHTADIYRERFSEQKLSTTEFIAAIAARLGQKPADLKPAQALNASRIQLQPYQRKAAKKKELLGVDIFIDWKGLRPDELGNPLSQLTSKNLRLKMITNRGVKVWPSGFDETYCTDHWRCRFMSENQQPVSPTEVIELLQAAISSQFDVIKTENLYQFDGTPAFSLGQGQ